MVYEPAGSSDLFLIRGCMTSASNLLYVNFSTLYHSSLWRTDTIVFAKLNKPSLSNKPPVSINPPPQMSLKYISPLNRGFAVFPLSLATKETVEVCTQATVSPILSCVLWIIKEWVKY